MLESTTARNVTPQPFAVVQHDCFEASTLNLYTNILAILYGAVLVEHGMDIKQKTMDLTKFA